MIKSCVRLWIYIYIYLFIYLYIVRRFIYIYICIYIHTVYCREIHIYIYIYIYCREIRGIIIGCTVLGRSWPPQIRGMAPFILILDGIWKWVFSFKHPSFFLRVKRVRCLLNRNLDWPQGWSGLFEEKKDFFPFPDFMPLTVQHVAWWVLLLLT